MVYNRTQEVEVRKHFFEDDGRIPNNPELPLLVYPGLSESRTYLPRAARSYSRRTVGGGAWVSGVFSYHHYHSNAHEALCVMSGEANIALGRPEGTTVEVKAGDLEVIPAGVGYCNARSSNDFAVFGAYPRGQGSRDLRTGEEG
jgi:uncharacterized protein YjlB